MRNEALDGVLTADNLQKQMQAIMEGHCGLLVANQVLPMARIQIARDRAMAQTLTDAARRMPTAYEDRALGKPLVLLLAGRAHVDRLLGVPAHLPTDITARAIAMVGQTTETAATRNAGSLDAIWPTEPAPAKDYCAEFRNTRPPNATTNVTP